jgi:hypothetical protein
MIGPLAETAGITESFPLVPRLCLGTHTERLRLVFARSKYKNKGTGKILSFMRILEVLKVMEDERGEISSYV